MRGWSLVIVLAGCGRVGFDAAARGDASDAAGDGPPGMTVVAEWSALNPYDSQQFPDGAGISDNAPRAVAPLTAPFPEGFVVSVGRRLIELPSHGAAVVHDYTPAQSEMAGPDCIVKLTSGALPGFAGIYAGSTSLTDGDGVYRIDTAWTITRDQVDNNVSGLAPDETGAFDARGVPVLYFTGGNKGVFRRDSMTARTTIVTFGGDVGSLAIGGGQMFIVDSDGDPFPSRLWSIAPTSHAKTMLDTTTNIILAEGPIANGGLVGLRNNHDIVRYRADGSFDVLASTEDPHALWIDLTVPRAPHALAGRIVVLEWNTDTDTQRLLLLP